MTTTATVTAADLRDLLGAPLHEEVVAYFAASTKAPRPYVERQVTECLRYLYLVSRHRDRLAGLFLPVEQEIDEIWHYLILQTREYRELCEHRLPGGYFIEHRSIAYEDYQGDGRDGGGAGGEGAGEAGSGGEESASAARRARRPGRERAIEEALRWIPLYCAEFGPFDEEALPHWTIVRFLHENMGMSLAEIAALEPAGA